MADGTKIEWADASLNPIRARNRATELATALVIAAIDAACRGDDEMPR